MNVIKLLFRLGEEDFMWLKNEGFYMAELMISLSGWLIISGFFVPLYLDVSREFISISEKSQANYILYEYIQRVMVEDIKRTNTIVSRENKQYELIWQVGSYGEKTEVFLRYEDIFGKSVVLSETVQ